jgi:predicted PurR-regulated permease PerM
MNEDLSRRVIVVVLLGVFVALAYAVLYRFLIPVAWAAILAFATWPAYRGLCGLLRGQRTLSALIMTLVLGAAFVLPIIWIVVLMREELPAIYHSLTEQLARGLPPLPAVLSEIPYLGPWADGHWQRWTHDPNTIKEELHVLLKESSGEITGILGGAGRNAIKFAVALVTVFFFYRDGERIFSQLKRVLQRFMGPGVDNYLAAAGGTTKAVVYGLVATALAQGFLAGLGYWGAGLPTPALLGAVTALIALIPFGTPLVWGSAGMWLLVTGEVWAGIGLLLWGALVVSWIDNLIRPLVISQAARIPFLVVMFGVLGGLAAFGLIGLFVGPVILAVLMAVWREWLEEGVK